MVDLISENKSVKHDLLNSESMFAKVALSLAVAYGSSGGAWSCGSVEVCFDVALKMSRSAKKKRRTYVRQS